MIYIIDQAIFESLAEEIIYLFNLYQKTNKYQTHNVEILSQLMDYKDGKGYQLISLAVIRNYNENVYDYAISVIDSPEAALKYLLNDLRTKVMKEHPEKVKERMYKLN